MFAHLDANGDGKLTRHEFAQLLEGGVSKEEADELWEGGRLSHIHTRVHTYVHVHTVKAFELLSFHLEFTVWNSEFDVWNVEEASCLNSRSVGFGSWNVCTWNFGILLVL